MISQEKIRILSEFSWDIGYLCEEILNLREKMEDMKLEAREMAERMD